MGNAQQQSWNFYSYKGQIFLDIKDTPVQILRAYRLSHAGPPLWFMAFGKEIPLSSLGPGWELRRIKIRDTRNSIWVCWRTEIMPVYVSFIPKSYKALWVGATLASAWNQVLRWADECFGLDLEPADIADNADRLCHLHRTQPFRLLDCVTGNNPSAIYLGDGRPIKPQEIKDRLLKMIERAQIGY